jgi:hypothetical protein
MDRIYDINFVRKFYYLPICKEMGRIYIVKCMQRPPSPNPLNTAFSYGYVINFSKMTEVPFREAYTRTTNQPSKLRHCFVCPSRENSITVLQVLRKDLSQVDGLNETSFTLIHRPSCNKTNCHFYFMCLEIHVHPQNHVPGNWTCLSLLVSPHRIFMYSRTPSLLNTCYTIRISKFCVCTNCFSPSTGMSMIAAVECLF